jgi:polyribonucleotide nucleotidyltransferase
MDIKIAGITREIFEAALNQAKEGRAHILGERLLRAALRQPTGGRSRHAKR